MPWPPKIATAKPSERPLVIKPGTQVWDKDNKMWIYVGFRITSVGSHSHYFCRMAENGQLYTYQASVEATLRRKFRGIS